MAIFFKNPYANSDCLTGPPPFLLINWLTARSIRQHFMYSPAIFSLSLTRTRLALQCLAGPTRPGSGWLGLAGLARLGLAQVEPGRTGWADSNIACLDPSENLAKLRTHWQQLLAAM